MHSLTNHFLIAMPGLSDRNFHQSVTYITEHTQDGAMGIVINHPLDITLAEILEQLTIKASVDSQILTTHLYDGGPVQSDHGFILHDGEADIWQSSIQVDDALCVTSSTDILEAIAHGDGPQNSLIALGYAGWGAGQLESEIAANSWLCGTADKEIIFQLPAQKRWSAAAQTLGVDIALLSSQSGHA